MTETADDQVEALSADVWSWRLAESPELSTFCGVHENDDQLDDISEEAYIKRENMVQEFLKRAEKIDISKTSKHKESLLLLIDQLQEYLDGAPFKCYYFPVNNIEGVHTDMMHTIEFMKFNTVHDFEVYVSRLEKLPKKIEQTVDVLQKGIEAKMVMHQYSVEEVPAQLDKLISAPVDEHPYLKPFKDNKTVSDEDLSKVKTRALDVLSSLIVPAFQNMKQFIVEIYFKNLRSSECVCSLPNGPRLYQQCLNFHLSCTMSPKEIHELGLREVERIRQQMSLLAEKEGFGSIFDYTKHLSTKDENFSSKDDILLYIKDLCHNKIRPKLQHFFKNLPLAPLNIVPCPEVMATSPAAFYYSGTPDGSRAGIYYINLHRKLSKYTLTSLSLHEGEPGHHLQSVYAMAEKTLPDFRRFSEDGKSYLAPSRFSSNTAYIEGWGLYSEALGEEMGAFENSDTLWSQQKAVSYLTDQMCSSFDELLSEVNRYITWPGQLVFRTEKGNLKILAFAGMCIQGWELKIWELRHRAEEELGDEFELAEFHDTILRCGAVPLRVLQTIVEDYVKNKKNQRLACDDNSVEGQDNCELNSDK
ncbi:hypothetical protein C0Q70_05846 [Pomacea canaliculata]|uniref:DUF885 domain-containing protein n=1 Tax=Pomacea canaliculata TaxID=400727 RepID=A0A2T7PMB8_POMCA|nr:hypothetical protein C0Q70_05846 [Pomacea canaliculata]